MILVVRNNKALSDGSCHPTILRKRIFSLRSPNITRRRKQTLMLSLFSMFLLHSWPATAAEGVDNDNPPVASMDHEGTLKLELIDRLESIKSMRIVMHAQKPAQKLADHLQSLLNIMGAAEVEKRIVDKTPDSNQVRYYHPADKEAGQVVQEALSPVLGEVAVRSFEDYEPAPADGLIEIWLR